MKKALPYFRTGYRFCSVWLLSCFVANFVYSHTPLMQGTSYRFLAVVSLLMATLAIYSLTRLLVLFDASIRYTGTKSRKELLVFFLSRTKAWVALILFAALPLPYYAFAALFGAHGFLLDYLISRSVLPFFFIAYLLGGMAGLTYYQLNRTKKRRTSDFFFLLHAIKFLPIYALGGVFSNILIPSLLSIPGMIKLLLSIPFTFVLMFFYAILWTVRIIRAVTTRRAFLRLLTKTCAERGIEMPVIKHPYRSLFRKKYSPVFSVTINEKKYICRLIGTMRPYTLYRFYENGIGARVKFLTFRLLVRPRFGAMLYQSRTELWETQFDFAFDAPTDSRKILIFNPCSKFVEGEDLGKRYPLDNGLSVGKYRFYTATSFCNALARDCLERKPTE